jgi:hypothetical protein
MLNSLVIFNFQEKVITYNYKYILERKKRIDLENSSEKRESSQHDTFNEGDIFFTCSSIFGVISNKALLNASVIDNKVPNMKYLYSLVYQDQSIKSSFSKNNKVAQTITNNSIAGNNSKNIDRSKANMDTLLMYEAIIKKSNLSPEKKRKAMIALNKAKKDMKELQLVGRAADELSNNIFNFDAKFTPKNCLHCEGTGTMKVCKLCDGRGIVYCSRCSGRKYLSDGRVCLECSGQGLLRCNVCNGRKYNIKCNHKMYL